MMGKGAAGGEIFLKSDILFQLKWPFVGLESFWFLENDGFWQEGP